MAFVSADDAKRIEPGMAVRVSPTTVRREEFGTIRGTAASVSPFPLSSAAIAALVTNQDLADQFAASGAPLLVRVRLDKTADGRLAWTGAQSPPVDISAGTLASASVVVSESAPISLVMPMLRRWTGLS